MSVITVAMKHLMMAGLSGEELVNAIAEIEAAAYPKSQAKGYGGSSRWQRLRQYVFERDDYTCVYCGADVTAFPQCDHIHPKALGGEDELDNLNTACKSCNSSKGCKTLEEWISCH